MGQRNRDCTKVWRREHRPSGLARECKSFSSVHDHGKGRLGSAGAFEAYQYEFSSQYGTFNLNTAGTDAMDGNWHHVIMNYDSTQSTNSDRVRFFLDGSEVSITTSSWPAQNQYTTFADGGNNSYVGRNGYTDAYTTDMKWADTYLAHTKRYDADYGACYYLNENTGEMSWYRPAITLKLFPNSTF